MFSYFHSFYPVDLEKKAIVYPTDKEVVCPDTYKVLYSTR